jgi:hypothetical protein
MSTWKQIEKAADRKLATFTETPEEAEARDKKTTKQTEGRKGRRQRKLTRQQSPEPKERSHGAEARPRPGG